MKQSWYKVVVVLIVLGMASVRAAGETPSLSRRELLLTRLFAELSPEPFGPGYPEALRRGDRAAAIKLVADYYRRRPDNRLWLDRTGDYDADAAKGAIRGEVSVVNRPYRFPAGRIDFRFDPTAETPPVNNEWTWQLNRMRFWRDMAAAYRKTGDENYAKAFNRQLLDWVEIPPPEGRDWNRNEPRSAWRTIDAGIRLSWPWPVAFEVFRKSPSVPDETLALMLASMEEQAEHLLTFRSDRNWLAMEMNGVYAFAAAFPEFKQAAAMRRDAGGAVAAALEDQILPDGMQNELSPDYHNVVFSCNYSILRLAQQYGYVGELPATYVAMLEKAADACLAMVTPGVMLPRTNDCYTVPAASLLQNAYRLFPSRQDFRWGATDRAEGTPPPGPTASRFLPWAGFAVMRSDWGPEATYLCFDVGPLGMMHEHQDKLNINVYQGNEELIYDDGGGPYEKSVYRWYARSGAAHNTLLVDGLSQYRTVPRKSENPIDAGWVSNRRFDYAGGNYEDGFGSKELKSATHRREILFVKDPNFFCIADTVKSRDGKAHDYELLFHLDTVKTESVAALPKAIRSRFGRKRDILMVPLRPEEVRVWTDSARMKPRLAGWYVGRNDASIHPATTVTMLASKQRDFHFATLLFPLSAKDQPPEIKRLSATRYAVSFKGKTLEFDLDDLRGGPR